jgi:starvation-inducible DNA-binding protein
MVLIEARKLAREATDRGDDGTNDLLVSDVVRTNELQSWFISEHLVSDKSMIADTKPAPH